MNVSRTLRKSGAPAGVYIHVPFCERLCPYCDFAVSIRREIPHVDYADALLAELEFRLDAGELDGRTVSTIYIGGGTPSLMDPVELARVMDRVRRIGLNPGAEVTIEANPASVDADRIAVWKACGVNRISLGVQSFQDDYLTRLGRNHDSVAARRAIDELIGAGFDTSFDLIFAGPNHSMATWERDLTVLSELPVLHHVSAYHLTIEPRTVFARRWRQGTLELPDDDVAVEMLIRLRDVCRLRGVEQYEVSSYAAPGQQSRHNTHYWTGSEYLGLGVGAHGLRISDSVAVRTSNDRSLAAYLNSPTAVRAEESITALTHLGERLFTGLRTARGMVLAELREQFLPHLERDPFEGVEAALHLLVEKGWTTVVDDRFVPTDDGYLFADSAAQIVWEAVAA